MSKSEEPPSGDRPTTIAEYQAWSREKHRRSRRHKSRRHSLWARVPVVVAFYVLVVFALAGVGLVYLRGVQAMPVSVLACAMIVYGMVLSDKKAYHKRSPRLTKRPRHQFNQFEFIFLGVLLIGNLLMMVLRLAT